MPSEDSDQPGHLPNLIRVFAVRVKKAWVLSYPLSAQWRLWSDWADAQADLSLRWVHSHFVGFVMSWLICSASLTLLHTWDISWDIYNCDTTEGLVMILAFSGVFLWVWHFLGLCECGFSMIVTLPLGLSRIVALLWASIILLFPAVYDWHFLRHVCDCGTCYGLSMIVTLPGSSLWCDLLGAFMIMIVPWASLWLWHFLGPLYYCEASLSIYDCSTFKGLSMIVALPVGLYGCGISLGLCDCDTSWGLCDYDTSRGTWLCHFLGSLCDCETFLSINYCGTSWGLFDCETFLSINCCGTSWGLSLIVKLSWA